MVIAIEIASSPVAHPGIQTRSVSLNFRSLNKAGRILSANESYTLGSLKKLVTVIRRSWYNAFTSLLFSLINGHNRLSFLTGAIPFAAGSCDGS
jgi:hypothetical protein